MWIVWIVSSELRFIVVNFLICLTKEIVESVARNCLILSKCFSDLVADSMWILLVRLAWAASREEESPCLTLSSVILMFQEKVFLRWIKPCSHFFALLFVLLLWQLWCLWLLRYRSLWLVTAKVCDVELYLRWRWLYLRCRLWRGNTLLFIFH